MTSNFFQRVVESVFFAKPSVGGDTMAVGAPHHAFGNLQFDCVKRFAAALGDVERFVVVDVVKVESRRVVSIPTIDTSTFELLRRDVGPFFGEADPRELCRLYSRLFRVFLLPFFGAGHGFSTGQGLAFRVKLASTAVLGLLSSAVAEFFFMCHSDNVIRRKKWHNTITLQLRGTL